MRAMLPFLHVSAGIPFCILGEEFNLMRFLLPIPPIFHTSPGTLICFDWYLFSACSCCGAGNFFLCSFMRTLFCFDWYLFSARSCCGAGNFFLSSFMRNVVQATFSRFFMWAQLFWVKNWIDCGSCYLFQLSLVLAQVFLVSLHFWVKDCIHFLQLRGQLPQACVVSAKHSREIILLQFYGGRSLTIKKRKIYTKGENTLPHKKARINPPIGYEDSKKAQSENTYENIFQTYVIPKLGWDSELKVEESLKRWRKLCKNNYRAYHESFKMGEKEALKKGLFKMLLKTMATVL